MQVYSGASTRTQARANNTGSCGLNTIRRAEPVGYWRRKRENEQCSCRSCVGEHTCTESVHHRLYAAYDPVCFVSTSYSSNVRV